MVWSNAQQQLPHKPQARPLQIVALVALLLIPYVLLVPSMIQLHSHVEGQEHQLDCKLCDQFLLMSYLDRSACEDAYVATTCAMYIQRPEDMFLKVATTLATTARYRTQDDEDPVA